MINRETSIQDTANDIFTEHFEATTSFLSHSMKRANAKKCALVSVSNILTVLYKIEAYKEGSLAYEIKFYHDVYKYILHEIHEV